MIVITDGVPNCTQMGSGDPYGGSSMITSPNDQSCDGQTGSSGNSNLMNNAWDLATLAGQNGISVSVIYYSGDGSCSPANTCVSELEELEGNSKTQLNLYHPGSVQPQFFSEPTAANLASDMLQICAAGLSKPRLVL